MSRKERCNWRAVPPAVPTYVDSDHELRVSFHDVSASEHGRVTDGAIVSSVGNARRSMPVPRLQRASTTPDLTSGVLVWPTKVSRSLKTDSNLRNDKRASDGNRTRTTSLGSWSSAIELHSRGRATGFPEVYRAGASTGSVTDSWRLSGWSSAGAQTGP